MIARRARLAAVAAAALLLLSACEAVTPSVATTDVFTAAPWRVGERLEYRLRTADGTEIGRGLLLARAEGDRTVLQQSFIEVAPPAGATPQRDEVAVTVDSRTLRPLSGRRETAARDAEGRAATTRTSWTYAAEGEGARLTARVERGDGTSEGTLAVRPHGYDNESSLWLWRGIAFAEGYDASYVSVNPIVRTQQTVTLKVPQREQIEVPAGRFDTWRILLRTGRAVRTAWISTAAPYPVVRWDNGDVIFELLSAPSTNP